jgi:hypothetical protein
MGNGDSPRRALKTVCSKPPADMELEVQWQEHDLGEYRIIICSERAKVKL